MKTTLQLTAPDELQATVTLSGTIKEFRIIAEALKTGDPNWYIGSVGQVISSIHEAIRTAESHFTAPEEPK